MRLTRLNLMLALSLALAVACGGEKAHDHDHDHGEGHDHAQDEHHEDGDGGHEHGQVRHDLGEQSVQGWTVRAIQMDEAVGGGETVFYVHIGGEGYTAGRIWVGDEAASHSIKALLEHIEGDRYHAHVEIPEPLGDTDKFYVEIDNATGDPSKLAFEIKR